MKDKIYLRCKRLNEELISTKKQFENKMSQFFTHYCAMLKAIIYANNKVI